jgi:hypothetical protein
MPFLHVSLSFYVITACEQSSLLVKVDFEGPVHNASMTTIARLLDPSCDWNSRLLQQTRFKFKQGQNVVGVFYFLRGTQASLNSVLDFKPIALGLRAPRTRRSRTSHNRLSPPNIISVTFLKSKRNKTTVKDPSRPNEQARAACRSTSVI